MNIAEIMDWIITDSPANDGQFVGVGNASTEARNRVRLMFAARMPHTFEVIDDTGVTLLRGKCDDPLKHTGISGPLVYAKSRIGHHARAVVYPLGGEAKLTVHL